MTIGCISKIWKIVTWVMMHKFQFASSTWTSTFDTSRYSNLNGAFDEWITTCWEIFCRSTAIDCLHGSMIWQAIWTATHLHDLCIWQHLQHRDFTLTSHTACDEYCIMHIKIGREWSSIGRHDLNLKLFWGQILHCQWTSLSNATLQTARQQWSTISICNIRVFVVGVKALNELHSECRQQHQPPNRWKYILTNFNLADACTTFDMYSHYSVTLAEGFHERSAATLLVETISLYEISDYTASVYVDTLRLARFRHRKTK